MAQSSVLEVATVDVPKNSSRLAYKDNSENGGPRWPFSGLHASDRWHEMLRSAANFNRNLNAERRSRLPFLDPHTSIAQTHCNLWFSPDQRLPRIFQYILNCYHFRNLVSQSTSFIYTFLLSMISVKPSSSLQLSLPPLASKASIFLCTRT